MNYKMAKSFALKGMVVTRTGWHDDGMRVFSLDRAELLIGRAGDPGQHYEPLPEDLTAGDWEFCR